MRLEVIHDEAARGHGFLVLQVHHDAWIRVGGSDGAEFLPLAPQVLLAGSVALHDVGEQRQEHAAHDLMRVRTPHPTRPLRHR